MRYFLIHILIIILSLNSFSQQITQSQKLFASDRDIRDHFGQNIKIFDDFAFVAAPDEGDSYTTDSGLSSENNHMGAVYVYVVDSNGSWVESQKLIGSNRKISDRFGSGLERSDSVLVIGAYNYGELKEGASYVFELNQNGQWVEVQRLQASDKEEGSFFGGDVSVSNNIIVVGAFGHSKGKHGSVSLKQSGAAYIFERDNQGEWQEKQKLVSPNRVKIGRFGHTVFMSNEYLAIGAINESTDQNGEDSLIKAGAVYIYELDSESNWVFAQKITPSDRYKYENFGMELKIQNNELFVGVCHKVVNDFQTAGAVYVFEKGDRGVWEEQQKIIAPEQHHRDYFGHSLAIYNNVMLVGGGWTKLIGAAYLYVKNECGIWALVKEFGALGEEIGKDPQDNYGAYVSISKNNFLIGAPHDRNAPGKQDVYDAGSSFLYKYSGFDSIRLSCDSIFPGENIIITDSTILIIDTIDSSIVEPEVYLDSVILETDIDTIEENNNDRTEFNIYPLRNNGNFTIEIIGKNDGPYPVSIQKVFGGIIQKLDLEDQKTEVQLPRQAKGVYLVKITTSDGVQKTPIYVK